MSSSRADTTDWDESQAEQLLQDMERDWEAASGENPDYYSVLNVTRQATTEDMRDSYRRLSLLFHPDRHHDSERREWAQRQFHTIQRAYEVLTNPGTRAAYDQLGEEGVRAGLAVSYKMTSVKELQEKFEREARMRRLQEVEDWVQSKSDISINVDSSKVSSTVIKTLLAQNNVSLKSGHSGLIGIQQLFMKHSFTANLANSVSGTVTGHIVSRSQRGYGNVIGTLKHTISPQSWVSVSLPALPPYVLTVKSTHQMSPETFCTTQFVQHTPNFATPPAATVTVGRLLFRSTMGVLTMRTGNQYALGSLWSESPTRGPLHSNGRSANKPSPGRVVMREQSGVTVGLSSHSEGHSEYRVDVTAGLNQSYVTARYSRDLDSHFTVAGELAVVAVGAPMPVGMEIQRIGEDTNVELASPIAGLQGLGDVSASIDMLSEIDSWTKLGWKVECGFTSGVKSTIYLQRLGHKIQLPILLSPMLELDVAMYAIAVPALLAFGVHYGILKPRRRRLIKKRLEELKENQRFQLFQQKQHAEEAVRLMADTVEHKRKNARLNHGLVIEKALYGDLPFGTAAQDCNPLSAALGTFRESRTALAATDEPRACEVTLALQAIVANDRLVIAGGGSKRFLPGFYDPAFGAKKSLFIRYSFKGQLHEVVVKDDQALAIPMRAHLVEK